MHPKAFLFSCLMALALILGGCSNGGDSAKSGTGQKYHCPMHPTYVSDRPGDCPICNMKLVPIKTGAGKSGAGSEAAHQHGSDAAKTGSGTNNSAYYCPMCPEVASDVPANCPECNMKLLPRDKTASDPSRTAIQVSPEKRHLIGLTTSTVQKTNLSRVLRTAAIVEHDETRYARIAPRFGGWVKKLHVNFTGAPVKAGQPLFTVYSPELYSTENEYLVAWRAVQDLKNSANPAQTNSTHALLEAARLRLSLFEIGEDEIKELEKRGTPSPEMLFRAPFSGHVLEKNAVEGKAFMAGDSLYEIADLSRIWLRAAVYEHELPFVAEGQKAIVSFPFRADKKEAVVTFVYPHIDPQSRRGEVRLELDNPEHLFRPGMWANVELEISSGEVLAVPSSAVIDTGKRYVAFVDGPDHHLEPRTVKIGARTDDWYEILEGLEEDEEVVNRALFLVDSESQLKAAIAGMTSGGNHAH